MIQSRRKSDRALVAGLVVVIFLLLATLAIVVASNMERTRQIHRLARNASSAAENTERLVERYKPCLPAEPESPACQRQREAAVSVNQAIDRIRQALANGLEAHDLNAHVQHEEIRALLLAAVDSPTTSPLPRTPITTSTTSTSPTTTAPAPPPPTPAPSPPPTSPGPPVEAPRTVLTTPTTRPPVARSPVVPQLVPCPTLPNGRCHPGRSQGGGR